MTRGKTEKEAWNGHTRIYQKEPKKISEKSLSVRQEKKLTKMERINRDEKGKG